MEISTKFVFGILQLPLKPLLSLQTPELFTLLDNDQNHYSLVSRLSLTADQIYMSGDDPGSRRGVEGSKSQKLFVFGPIYNAYKNQPSRSFRREDLKSFSSIDLEKRLFLPCLPTKLSQEVEIQYVHLVGTLNVLFGSLDFSAPLHSLTCSQ